MLHAEKREGLGTRLGCLMMHVIPLFEIQRTIISSTTWAARLRSRARKHYNMRSVLRRIFWNAHNVLCMGGAASYYLKRLLKINFKCLVNKQPKTT